MNKFLLVFLGCLFAPAVLGLQSHYSFEEGTGSTAIDASGQGNDGTISGAVYSSDTADSSAYALDFDGVDDTVDLGLLDSNTGQLTLAAWIKPDSFPGRARDPRIISKATGTSANDHIFMLSTIKVGSATRLRARLHTGGSTTTIIADSGDLATGVNRTGPPGT